ncbi:PKD domain-containing protein [Chryseolinea sp. T2]|uniref:leucine-rich repeat domain-containing protein n=1 Tax=Chryseolinea sp. T2 TaxID=3129255 RepID=UPI00307750F1
MTWRLFLIVTLTLCGSLVRAQGVVSDAVERSALLDIYNTNMLGLDTTNAQSWTPYRISRFPTVGLSGVTYTGGDIVGIALSGLGMHGVLSSGVVNLSQLKSLNLNQNDLTGLPSLTPLTHLQILRLQDNNFGNAVFPSWIGQLTSLQELDLYNCQLIGPLPSTIGQLTSLTVLTLSRNNLSASNSIPSQFSGLISLEKLYLDYCSLLDASIHANAFSGLPKLNLLSLNYNSALIESGIYFPAKFHSLPSLTTLNLQANGFTEFQSNSLTTMLNLQTIDFSFTTRYSDPAELGRVIDQIKPQSNIKTVKFSNCNIQSLPADFGELDFIETLYLDNNTDILPSSCQQLAGIQHLTKLYMANCDLNSLPSDFQYSSSLRELYISGNALHVLPTTIMKIPALKKLDISSNSIVELPSWFGGGNMGTLESLMVRSNGLTSLPDSVVYLTNLTYLDLQQNKLTGTWPNGFADGLKKVQYFNVNFNNITTLPDLSTWADLAYVFVQRNKLNGEIPDYLTQKTSTKIQVDFSYNGYTSVSPGYGLSNASFVNVANNKLTFKYVKQLDPAGTYLYVPQDTVVDKAREVRVIQPAPVRLVAFASDTLAALNCEFQWFRYVDGINDVPLFTASTHEGYHYSFEPTEADQGAKFYYKVTNSAFTSGNGLNLVYKSNLITVVILCESVPLSVNFSNKKYMCAVGFTPTAAYEEGCRTKSISWDFGDGTTSQDKSPLHAYSNEGTFTVRMNLQYTCGICVRDTLVSKTISFRASPTLLKDTTITVYSEQKNKVLAASAATFSDAWLLHQDATPVDADAYSSGSRGVWRNEGTFVYDTVRELSTPTNIGTDGTFSLYNFNWAQAEVGAIPQWIKANTMTEYSAYSYELENEDVLGVFTAALYDYGGHLPSANGVNMRNREMAFTGFEFFDNNLSGNWVFGTNALPASVTYEVYWGNAYMAIVKTSLANLENVTKVDVSSRGLASSALLGHNRSNFISDDEIVCVQTYPSNPEWSIIVLRRAPFEGIWRGKITVNNVVSPAVVATIDQSYGHTGRSSLKVVNEKTFKQPILKLDSAKTYHINAWVSTGTAQLTAPKLGDQITLEVKLVSRNGATKLLNKFEPAGPIIEGWQQVKGTFVPPDDFLNLELTFNAGTAGTVWYDDIRLHPEKGNMKSYVYDITDYRLRAILDEENFASSFYYDKEGNLYLTKKETEAGIKTISENVSYMKENKQTSSN